MKALSLAALGSLATTLVVARDCPVESECIQKVCTDIHITDQVKGIYGPMERMLGATCEDLHGTKVFTWDNVNRGTISLSEGIWQYNGRIGCYKDEGGLVPISPVKKKRSNEPETFTLPLPGKTVDENPHPVEQPGDGSAHGPPRTPDTPDRYIDETNERRSNEPRILEFPRDDNTPFGDDDSQEEPAYDDGNGKRFEESHAEHISERGRSFRKF
ncbi:hypothetical protein COL922a_004259 [Colletotrichum nupharicola]|nr:hypothetical protein COL922a_004259 [Colletotrichum nupharicola]